MRRFKVVRAWELDGYRVAAPLPLSDAPLPDGSRDGVGGVGGDDGSSADAAEVAELIKDVEAAADACVRQIACVCECSPSLVTLHCSFMFVSHSRVVAHTDRIGPGSGRK